MVLSLLLLSSHQTAGGSSLQAADLCGERGADSRTLRQRGSGFVHPVCGRPGAGGLHGGDAAGKGPGSPLICEPQPADARLAALPGEGVNQDSVWYLPISI